MVMCAHAAGVPPPADAAAGYADDRYLAALSHLGEPLSLPGCGGYVLRRDIPNSSYADAMGPVPMFDCRDWSALGEDMERLAASLVSLVMIPSPFGDLDASGLQRLFPDLMREYKRHYVVHVAGDWEADVSRHHRYYARRAVKNGVTVRSACDGGASLTDDWISLYRALARRHGIKAPYDFPPASLASQLAVPGMHVYEARLDSAVVGMQLWLQTGRYAYYHLSAYCDAGYRTCASYAMVRHVLADLQDKGVEWVDLGAGAGQGDNGSAGLGAFKSGWAGEKSLPVFLCGRVFKPAAYKELTDTVPRDSGYFPAYRAQPTA